VQQQATVEIEPQSAPICFIRRVSSIALFVPAQLNSGQNRRHRGEFTLAKARGLAEFAVPLGESGALKHKGPITRREENVA